MFTPLYARAHPPVGERVVRPRGVVAGAFGGIVAHEDAAGRRDAAGGGPRSRSETIRCSGGVGFGEVEHVVLRIEYDDPALRERFAEDRIAGTRGRLPAEGVVHAACERDGAADEHCLTVAAVFGLREQVGGREVGRGPFVGEHQHLRRSGRKVDGRAFGADELLGAGDVAVARPEDLVDARHAFGAVGHGGDGLRPSEREDAPHAAQRGGVADFGGDAAVAAGRGAEDDFGAAGDRGRHGEHEHRRKRGAEPPGT